MVYEVRCSHCSLRLIIYLYEFQVDGKIQLHSLSPEIRSIFDQIWHHHFWNIENSSILLSLKGGFVLNLERVTNQWSFFIEYCIRNTRSQFKTILKNLKLKIAENQQMEENALAYCLCVKSLLLQDRILGMISCSMIKL